MPTGPKGQKRPADAIGLAVMVGQIATGEIVDTESAAPNRAKGGKVGGQKRAANLSADERVAIAKKGAKARWEKL